MTTIIGHGFINVFFFFEATVKDMAS